ncbi:MAG: hypothetical protein IPL38_20320 [Rhodobacter sp.]|nr:hypothetical protein [Rhodobacter sp.]
MGKGAPRYGNRPGMATYAQLELIRELWRELHEQRQCDDAALAGWPLKYHKVHSMRFLTMDGARKGDHRAESREGATEDPARRDQAAKTKGRAEGSAPLALQERARRALRLLGPLTLRKLRTPFNFAGITFDLANAGLSLGALDRKSRRRHDFGVGMTR